MDIADGIEAFVRSKRKHRHTRRWQRKQIRKMSHRLVKSGEIPQTPCLICGSREDLTIHHFEPMRPDRFAFLCRPCHDRADRPLYRAIAIPVPFGQFSVLPQAAAPRKEAYRG